MKKILGIGALATIALPIATTISCGENSSNKNGEGNDEESKNTELNLLISDSPASWESSAFEATKEIVNLNKNLTSDTFCQLLTSDTNKKMSSSIFANLYANVKGGEIIGVVKKGGFIFEATIGAPNDKLDKKKIMFLIGGSGITESNAEPTWGGNNQVVLERVYGNKLSQAVYIEGKSEADVKAYVAFTISDDGTKIEKCSIGKVTKAKPSSGTFADDNDLLIVTPNYQKSPGVSDILKIDALNASRNIYGSVAWSTDEAKAIINSNLSGVNVANKRHMLQQILQVFEY